LGGTGRKYESSLNILKPWRATLLSASGDGPLEEAAHKVIEVITFAREQGIRNLLIDATHWTGHPNPSLWNGLMGGEASRRQPSQR